MNPEEAKEYSKGFLSEYLNANGINTSTTFSCINPSHDDKHPSMSFDSRRNRCHCFSCGADYDIFDAARVFTKLEGRDLFNFVYSFCHIDVEYNSTSNTSSKYIPHEVSELKYTTTTKVPETREPLSDFFDTCHNAVEKTDYWKKRGLSKSTVDRFNLGYWEEKRRFVIPTGLYSYNARATWDADKKDRYLKPKGQFELFNLHIIPEAETPVFVVEGEFDALSIIEAGYEAVALGSSGNMKFIEYVKANRPLYPLIIALDNDEAGEAGKQRIFAELSKADIPFSEADITLGFKDANEALTADRDAFFDSVKNAVQKILSQIETEKKAEQEEYYKTSAANSLPDFINDINHRRDRDCVKTGFENMDKILDGGFYPGLYIIGAVSSLGKTTFALQIADNVAKNGHDVLVFSLEMGKQELISKSISRLSFQKCKSWGSDFEFATTTRNLLNASCLTSKAREDFINDCLKDYSKYAGHIFYHIGIGDIGVDRIKEIIERHITITGRRPFVVIDYLQILAPYDMRATDKQNTDKAVVELKRASRDFDVPVFAISSFNRENYTSPVNIASFKESGAIEYTSDVLMALQFKGMDYQQKEDGKYEDEKTRTARIIQLREEQEKNAEIPGKAQQLQLKILKNRNGRKGGVELDFHPMFNCFEVPKPDGNAWVLQKRVKK